MLCPYTLYATINKVYTNRQLCSCLKKQVLVIFQLARKTIKYFMLSVSCFSFSDKREEIRPRHSQQFLAYEKVLVQRDLNCKSKRHCNTFLMCLRSWVSYPLHELKQHLFYFANAD